MSRQSSQRVLLDHVKRRHTLIRVLQYAETDITQVKTTMMKLVALCEEDVRASKFLEPFFLKRVFHSSSSASSMDVSDRNDLMRKTKDLGKHAKNMANIKMDPDLVSVSALKRAIKKNESQDESFLNSIIFWRLITLAWGRISMVVALHSNNEADPFGMSLSEDDQMAVGDLICSLFDRIKVLESCGKLLTDWLVTQTDRDVPAIEYLISEFNRLPFDDTKRKVTDLSEELPGAKRLEVAVRRWLDQEDSDEFQSNTSGAHSTSSIGAPSSSPSQLSAETGESDIFYDAFET